MGGMNEVVVATADETAATRAMQGAAREVLRIETKYSRYRTDSDSVVYRINQAAGGTASVPCDPETMELFNFADLLFHKSGGLFDITSGILRRAWDFSKPVLPTQEMLDPLLALIDWNKVERSESGVRLRLKGMEIDFGGFGKEYASDRAAKILTAMGVAHGYVNLGGDIRAVGPRPDGQPWLIGVPDPRKPGAVIATIALSTGALATSGDYEKFIEICGRRYSHILNPKSGFPVNCWRSVSISSVTAISAGGHATIAMLKESEAESFLRQSNCAYFLVDLTGRFHSNGLPNT